MEIVSILWRENLKTSIMCRPTDKGIHTFYLFIGNERYFLFRQPYRKGVARYYGNGICIDEALNCSKAHGDTAIMKTMHKLPMYIRYVEKEYDLEVLRKTKKRGA